MNRKLNIDDLKEMVKDCVYEEENIVCMNNQYYRKLIKRINNLQSKIDKVSEYCKEVIKEHNNREYNVSTVELAVKEHKENIENVLDILKEDK